MCPKGSVQKKFKFLIILRTNSDNININNFLPEYIFNMNVHRGVYIKEEQKKERQNVKMRVLEERKREREKERKRERERERHRET